jgi:hypothetical protein
METSQILFTNIDKTNPISLELKAALTLVSAVFGFMSYTGNTRDNTFGLRGKVKGFEFTFTPRLVTFFQTKRKLFILIRKVLTHGKFIYRQNYFE